MLLMTKYSNEVSFLDLVTILTTLNNLKCRRFLGHPLPYLSQIQLLPLNLKLLLVGVERGQRQRPRPGPGH